MQVNLCILDINVSTREIKVICNTYYLNTTMVHKFCSKYFSSHFVMYQPALVDRYLKVLYFCTLIVLCKVRVRELYIYLTDMIFVNMYVICLSYTFDSDGAFSLYRCFQQQSLFYRMADVLFVLLYVSQSCQTVKQLHVKRNHNGH